MLENDELNESFFGFAISAKYYKVRISTQNPMTPPSTT